MSNGSPKQLKRRHAKVVKQEAVVQKAFQRFLKQNPDVKVQPNALFVWSAEEYPKRLYGDIGSMEGVIWVAFVKDALAETWLRWVKLTGADLLDGLDIEDYETTGGILRVGRLTSSGPSK